MIRFCDFMLAGAPPLLCWVVRRRNTRVGRVVPDDRRVSAGRGPEEEKGRPGGEFGVGKVAAARCHGAARGVGFQHPGRSGVPASGSGGGSHRACSRSGRGLPAAAGGGTTCRGTTSVPSGAGNQSLQQTAGSSQFRCSLRPPPAPEICRSATEGSCVCQTLLLHLDRNSPARRRFADRVRSRMDRIYARHVRSDESRDGIFVGYCADLLVD